MFSYGCSTWKNFSAYFNRFYIAEKAFDLAMEDIKENNPRPLFQFKENKLSSVANKNFDDVIKYSSKILQFNKDTKYVPEAIYMIAVAYYYKGQYSKALRKFSELDNLNIPDYKYPTMLWIAKSEMQMRSFLTALSRIEKIKNATDVDEDILFDAYVTEIRYLIYREEFSKAILAIEELLRQNLDDVVKSEVTYELGMLYESLGNYENAVNAFQLVWEGEPSFEIEFKSKLEYAKCVEHLNRKDEALEVLNDLRDDTKYEKYWDLVDIEIAQIELESGNIQDALDIFYSVDTGYTNSESSGIAAFMQADIMEHIFMNFDSAKFLYEKVVNKKAPPEYKKDAQEKVKILKLRKDYLDEILSSKRGYAYLQDTLLFKQDSIAYAGYLARRDSAMKAAEELKNNNESQGTIRRTRGRGRVTRGTAQALAKKFKYKEDSLFTYQPKMPLISEDSLRSKIAMNEYMLGNLYLGELEVPDSAFYYYNDIINNFPNTPFHARTLYALGSYYLTLDNKEKADSLFKYVYDNFNSEAIAKSAAARLGITVEKGNSDPALEEYRTAEENIEQNEYYDAIEKLNLIYSTYPESQYAPKSLYAIGWIYENKLSDYDTAVNYYDSLLTHFPKTEYAREVKSRVSFYHSEMKARQDSIARIQKAIADSIKADSLAHVQALSVQDSLTVTDSATTVQSDSIKVSTIPENNVEGKVIKDSVKSSALTDSAKAVELFKEAAKHSKKPKK